MRNVLSVPKELTQALDKVDEMHAAISAIRVAVERLVELEEEKQDGFRLRSVQ